MTPKNICLFSFDHGFSFGISSSSYDIYIAKRKTDYHLLKKSFKNKVIYIPCLDDAYSDCIIYSPFKNHNNIITASASARFYKLSGNQKDSYLNILPLILYSTKGTHFHYGPISQENLNILYKKMDKLKIPHCKFIHIEWEKNLQQSLLNNHIDIFIEPFPVVSYKLSLLIMAIGIPIIHKNAQTRLSLMDFTYKDSLNWNTKEELIQTLTSLSRRDLTFHSNLTLDYFKNNHEFNLLSQFYLKEQNFTTPDIPFVLDNSLINIDKIFYKINLEPQTCIKKITVNNINTHKQTNKPTKIKKIRVKFNLLVYSLLYIFSLVLNTKYILHRKYIYNKLNYYNNKLNGKN